MTHGFDPSIFHDTHPASLCQHDWVRDRDFVSCLHRSWMQHYEQYLGLPSAKRLLNRMTRDGSLFDHDPTLSLQAKVEDRLVGLCALRVLDKQHRLALITVLEVVASHQRNGIGSQMLRALETAGHTLVAHVSIHRPQVMSLYQSLGYHRLERQMVDYHGYRLEFDVVAKPHRPLAGSSAAVALDA